MWVTKKEMGQRMNTHSISCHKKILKHCFYYSYTILGICAVTEMCVRASSYFSFIYENEWREESIEERVGRKRDTEREREK